MSARGMSPRCREAWKRLSATYGADVIERRYGLSPPSDWVEVLEQLDAEQLAAVMVESRQRHTQFPPSLAEFEQLAKAAGAGRCGPDNAAAMNVCERVLERRSLTREQWIGLEWIAREERFGGKQRIEIVGCRVPADGDRLGFTVMAKDAQHAGSL